MSDAVPDTEAEALALAYFRDRPDQVDVICSDARAAQEYAATIVRAALARDAGQDERDRELAFLRKSVDTFERIVDRAFNAVPDDVEAEDDDLASYIRAALARDVPAGRDLTAQDVLGAMQAWRTGRMDVDVATVELNRIARGDQ